MNVNLRSAMVTIFMKPLAGALKSLLGIESPLFLECPEIYSVNWSSVGGASGYIVYKKRNRWCYSLEPTYNLTQLFDGGSIVNASGEQLLRGKLGIFNGITIVKPTPFTIMGKHVTRK